MKHYKHRFKSFTFPEKSKKFTFHLLKASLSQKNIERIVFLIKTDWARTGIFFLLYFLVCNLAIFLFPSIFISQKNIERIVFLIKTDWARTGIFFLLYFLVSFLMQNISLVEVIYWQKTTSKHSL